MKNTFLLLLFPVLVNCQNFSGKWAGELTQDGKPDVFIYQLELTQTGNNLEGIAISKSKDGSNAAKFVIGGKWNGSTLTLQEVEQLEPPQAKWCLKLIHLQRSEHDGASWLEGNWEAQGCTPGRLRLHSGSPQSTVRSLKSGDFLPAGQAFSILHSPFPMTGRWSGHLSQSDREYGFYIEMNLGKDGTGTSQIISDSEGGNATHTLDWQFDEANGILTFNETGISEKSVTSWRWCMKTGRLAFKKEENRLSLAGDWEGYIEGFTKESGPCAPGKLYLEQPVFKKEEVTIQEPKGSGKEEENKVTPIGAASYEKKTGRNVQVERVIEVKKKQIKIRVWDNGTVDGDVLSLFLNGKMLLNKYRVARQKYEILVTLDQPVNYLILHAINLGSISPNTVAVSVDDGTGEQIVMVSSTLKTSGAVMIREFTVK